MENFESIKLTEIVLGAAKKIAQEGFEGNIKDIPGFPGFVITADEPNDEAGLLLLGAVKNLKGKEYFICQVVEGSPS